MNLALRPYRCSTPSRKRVAPLSDPFGFGSGLLDEFFRLTEGGTLPKEYVSSRTNTLAYNLLSDENGYTLEFAVPGLKKEEIDLALDDGTLTISVNSSSVTEDEKDTDSGVHYTSKEWSSGSGKRALRLPADANAESLDANLKDGVLSVRISKLEEKQPLKVEIK